MKINMSTVNTNTTTSTNKKQNNAHTGDQKPRKILEPGTYTMAFANAEDKTSQNGNPYVDCRFVVVNDANPDNDEKVVYCKFPMHVKEGRMRLNFMLQALGLPKGIDDIDGDTNRLAEHFNKKLRCKVEHDTPYNGYERNKITKFTRL